MMKDEEEEEGGERWGRHEGGTLKGGKEGLLSGEGEVREG